MLDYKKMSEYLDSTEFDEKLNKYIEKINLKEKIELYHLDKLYNMGSFVSLLEKCIIKYNSDEYINKEYKLGYEPREPLYWFLYQYAQKYGRDCTVEEYEKYANDFTSGLVFCDDYIFNQMNGQGSVLKITKI